MVNIPVFGRISISDYVRIVAAYAFIIFEPILRILFRILPLRGVASKVFASVNYWLKPQPSMSELDLLEGERVIRNVENALLKMSSVDDFADYWFRKLTRGFSLQTHYITTTDGYILAAHRLPYSRAESKGRVVSDSPKPVVLLWHGFLMCSEVWVCSTKIEESLAFTLAEAGYDVWMGNVRGNKYSCKHRNLKPINNEFWDYSMDDLASMDVPNVVDYILKTTNSPSLSYIGFSQGSALGFAGLSLNPELAKKINLFIALAPSTKPKGKLM